MQQRHDTVPDRQPAGPWWTAALTDEERATDGPPPPWVRFVEDEVLADGSRDTGTSQAPTRQTELREDGSPRPGTPTGPDALAPALAPWRRAAAGRLAAALADPAVEGHAATTVLDDVLALLDARLSRLAARCLVTDLHADREAGRLAGDDPRARFADSTARTGSPSGTRALVHRYPVLARLLAQAVLGTTDAAREVLDRLAEDRDAVVAGVLDATDPGALTGLELGRGDTHGGGRSVAVLRFADGRRVVYKPRPLAVATGYAGLVDWLASRVPGLDLWHERTLDRGTYGWVEHVDHTPCHDVAQVADFYRRTGALLALLYAVDATDMHLENLVARGPHPVLVDVETLFHAAAPAPLVVASDPARGALSRSVLSTGLLPAVVVGEHGAVDLSGVGGERDGTWPDDVVRWQDAGLDTMHLVRTAAPAAGAARNRPVLDGVPARPHEHQDALLTGFDQAYRALQAAADELCAEDGPLAGLADAVTRLVLRESSWYARLLDETTHPDLLADAAVRDAVLRRELDDPSGHRYPGQAALVTAELAQLWAGDVPLFATRPGSRDVTDGAHGTHGTQTTVRLLDRPGLEEAVAKVRRLDELDRRRQGWVVRAALATTGAQARELVLDTAPGRDAAPDPQRVLAAACGIGDHLVAVAERDAWRASWLGVQQVDGHWAVLPMGAALADGYPGTALFLAELAELTGLERYRDLAASAAAPLAPLVGVLADDPLAAAAVGPGAHLGLGGVAHATAQLARRLDDPRLAAAAATATDLLRDLVGRYVADGGDLSLADGLAGGLTVLADPGVGPAGSGPAGSGAAADLLRQAAAALLASARAAGDALGTSLDRGLPGIAWAAACCARATGDDALAEAAGALLDGLAPAPDVATVRSCLGTGPWTGGGGGATPFHLLESLTAAGEPAAARRDRAVAALLDRLERHEGVCATPGGVTTPGLFDGLAGAGHGLLRATFPDRVPSLLLPGQRAAVAA
ncbi:type 2 lanthipeptide synthetase LanM family protein [Thalassiella azotivora]